MLGISPFLETSELLLDNLGSYRPCKDTTIDASIWAYDVNEGFQGKEETVIVALDLEDANNRLDFTTFLTQMLKGGVDTWLVW